MKILIVTNNLVLKKNLSEGLSNEQYAPVISECAPDCVQSALLTERHLFAVIVDFDMSCGPYQRRNMIIAQALRNELPVILLAEDSENEVTLELQNTGLLDKGSVLMQRNMSYIPKPFDVSQLNQNLLQFYP